MTIALIAIGAISQLTTLPSTNENSKGSMSISLLIPEARSNVAAIILKSKYMKINKQKKPPQNGGFFCK